MYCWSGACLLGLDEDLFGYVAMVKMVNCYLLDPTQSVTHKF